MRCRKKPVVVDAYQWNGKQEDLKPIPDDAPEWVLDAFAEWLIEYCENTHILLIDTLEGTMSVSPGDYIIKGVKDELSPCKPDIFELTYELVED